MDPHPVRWMRDVEVLLWTTSSGKRLRLGGGRSRVWGFVADFRGLGIRIDGRMGLEGEPWLRTMKYVLEKHDGWHGAMVWPHHALVKS